MVSDGIMLINSQAIIKYDTFIYLHLVYHVSHVNYGNGDVLTRATPCRS